MPLLIHATAEEADAFVKTYLVREKDFFRRHPEVFCQLEIPRQNRAGTRSVADCQVELLQRTLSTYEMQQEELKADLNAAKLQLMIQEVIHRLALTLLEVRQDALIPKVALEFLLKQFDLEPNAGLIRLWRVRKELANESFARPLGQALQAALAQMDGPYLGANEGPQLASWLGVDPAQTKSVLLAPLRDAKESTFGMLCLASPESTTFEDKSAIALAKGASLCISRALERLLTEDEYE